MTHRLVLTLALLLCLLLIAGSAHAQRRFGLETTVGGHFPASPSLHNIVTLDSERDVSGAESGVPIINDRWNRPGVALSLRVLTSSIEVGYTLELMSWGRTRDRCVGDREVTVLDDGSVDDSEVSYSCSRNPVRAAIPSDESDMLALHHINGGLRFYTSSTRQDLRLDVALEAEEELRRPIRPEFYGVISPGLTLTTYTPYETGGGLRPGFNMALGGGVEVRPDDVVVLVVDARYRFTILSTPDSPSANARRVVAGGRNVLSAVTDIYHSFTLNVGFRIEFR